MVSECFYKVYLVISFKLCVEEYERKGRLYKKSLGSHKFKERTFVLTNDNLIDFKSDS